MNSYLDTKITLNVLYCVNKFYIYILIYKNNIIHNKKYKSIENNKKCY